MNFIPDWNKKMQKFWTTRLAMAGTVLGMGAELLPNFQEFLPPKWYVGMFIAILVARIVAQPNAHDIEK
jgi:cytosine/uracil/thiamine/allantoin permease